MKRFVFSCISLLLSQAALAGVSASDFNAARDAYRTRDLARLEQLANKLQGDDLEIYPRYWWLSSQFDTVGDPQIRTFLQTYAGSLLAERLRSDWLKRLGRGQRWDDFSAEYPALVSPDAELNCYQLRARLAHGDTAASQVARPLWFTGKDMPEACGPLFEQLRDQGLITRDDVWQRLRLGSEENNTGLMNRMTALLPDGQAFTAKQLDSVAANPAAALKREQFALSTRGGRELAIYAVQRVGASDPALGAEHWRAMAKSFDAADQGYVWGQLALVAARKQQPQALAWFKEAGNTQLSPLQLEWKTRSALRVQDWTLALDTIEHMSASQQGEASWRYWRARCLKTLSRLPEANELLAPLSREHHFYGLLAKEELGSVLDAAAGRYKPSEDEVGAIGRLPSLGRAIALYKLDQRSDAVREWNWGVRNLQDTQLLAAAELAARHQWYDRAIYTADRTKDIHDFTLRYIAPYRDVVSEAAKQLSLDEAWVYGLMRQESRFVSVAKSHVGAGGLMQLLPATAKWVAQKLGYKKFRAEMVNEVGTNVQLGTYYLKHVLDSLGGQEVLATAAYNAGPGRARNWQDSRALDAAVYIETIPFTETRDYVKKVMANAYWYARTFNHDAPTLHERIGKVPAYGS